MPKKPFMPKGDAAIKTLLVAFDTNLNANSGALAAKYKIVAAELARIHQTRLVWEWFQNALAMARQWSQGLTRARDSLQTATPSPAHALPGLPALPAAPQLSAGPPVVLAQLEPGFFAFFNSIAARIKDADFYEVADGDVLGIEGAELAAPSAAATRPILTAALSTSGRPQLSCRKGLFQGYTIWLTRPGVGRRQIAFSTSRRFPVEEPLPAAGTAEVWTFEVQYRLRNVPFGQLSQPLNLTVRG